MISSVTATPPPENKERADRDWQRKVTRQLVAALDGIIGDADSLLRSLTTGIDPGPSSPFARQAPSFDDQTERGAARRFLWQCGMEELFTRFAVALNVARGVRALAEHNSGLVISPLVLARPTLEAAADTHMMVGGKPTKDRLQRFYAAMARDVVRTAAPHKTQSTLDASHTARIAQHQAHWKQVVYEASRAGYTLVTDPSKPTLFGPSPTHVLGPDGSRVVVNHQTSSILSNINPGLALQWQITSGAAHAAPWLAGSELRNANDNESRGAPWVTAVRVIAEALGVICDNTVKFTGTREANYREQNLHRWAKASRVFAQALNSDPTSRVYQHLHPSPIRLQDP